MQFRLRVPPFAERLVLVSSGGLGREVHLMLRVATLPGSEVVLSLIAHERLHGLGGALAGLLGRFGLRAGTHLAEMARGYGSPEMPALGRRSSTPAPGARHRLPARQRGRRLYLAALPSLVIWGAQDPLIPLEHATVANDGLPNSRLEVFGDTGHFPPLHDPVRFALTLIDFIESSEPTRMEFTDKRLRPHARAAASR